MWPSSRRGELVEQESTSLEYHWTSKLKAGWKGARFCSWCQECGAMIAEGSAYHHDPSAKWPKVLCWDCGGLRHGWPARRPRAGQCMPPAEGGRKQALEARIRANRDMEEAMAVQSMGLIPNMVCPLCRGPMAHKKNERGDFAGCANYPACKHADYQWRPQSGQAVSYGIHKDTRFASTCKGCGAQIAPGSRYYHESKGVTKCLSCAPESQAGAQAAQQAATITGGYATRPDGTILVPPMGDMPVGWRVLSVDSSGNVTMAPRLLPAPPIPAAQQLPLAPPQVPYQGVDFSKHLKAPDAQRAVTETFPGAAVRITREDPASMAADLLRITRVLLEQCEDAAPGVGAARLGVTSALDALAVPF